MNVRPHVIRLAATAAVLAPFGISVVAHVAADPVGRAASAERSELAFAEYLVNLGRLPDGVTARGLFRFKNAGEEPLTILGFTASCGCLKPRLDEMNYAPGTGGIFAVFADTANEASTREDSLKEHYVDVKYDAGNGEKTARVHLKFVLPARHVVVEPRSLLVYQFSQDPTTREITVTDPRTPPVTIRSVECPSPHVTVESELAESEGEETRAKVAVTIPGGLDRDVRTLLKLHTDDVTNPVIYVPIEAYVQKPGTPAIIRQVSGEAERRR
jgi:hypothetical protein